MDLEKMRERLELYASRLKDRWPPQEVPRAELRWPATDSNMMLQHVHWMIVQMRQMLTLGKTEDFKRWFAFLEGVLWSQAELRFEEVEDFRTLPPRP